MRALLVVNTNATATSERARDVLIRALGSVLKLDLGHTSHRGHAIELGRQAALEGIDVVVALGGDGTVNEVVNGLLADGPRAGQPALAIVPGGSANVLARSIGLPTSAVEATGVVLDALRAGRRRTIGLGQAGGRWFTFSAGLGLDAEVVDRVELRRRAGQRATSALYARTAVRQFFFGTDRRHPAITLERPDAAPVPRLHLAIVSNSSPWTYYSARPVNPNPGASFDSGLALCAMRQLRTVSTLRMARHMFTSAGPHGRAVLRLADLTEFTLRADRPLAFQVDGDFLGNAQNIAFRAVPAALDLVV